MIDMRTFLPKKLVLTILCGLIINIAVALSCATLSNFSSSDQEVVLDAESWPREVGPGWPRESILITTEHAFGLTLIKSRAMVKRRKDPIRILTNYLDLIRESPSDLPDRQRQWIEEATVLLQAMQSEGDAGLEEQVTTVTNFIRTASVDLDETVRKKINRLMILLTDRSSNYSQFVREAGWPFRALDAEARSDQSLEPRSRYAIDLGVIRGGLQKKTELWLPLRPRWPGFLLNTVFYTLILWPISLLPGLYIHIRRKSANKCPSCGTDIGVDSVCEQCGQDLSDFWGN